MNTNDYNEACLNTLQDKEFYETVSNDPNPIYRKTLDKIIDELKVNGYISETEEIRLKEGTRTPCFYGLPKIHKTFEKFPPLRPICSGYSSCSSRLSEWVDSFLKPSAMQTSSYIRDTTDFVNKLEEFKNNTSKINDSFLVTMDVSSLYPNIDHGEGIAAGREALERRTSKSVPSDVIADLIAFILKSNTLSFDGKFYHQIKGTAMGTPMAVSFANLFMSKFETNLLDDYKKEYQKGPVMWIRYIDDVFFVWDHNQEELMHFLSYCNSYAAKNSYKSTIKFTMEYSKSDVVFLDTKVKKHDGTMITELHCKPTATHTYLHKLSDHPTHTLRSNPLSQFIRIRRICHLLTDYRKHATQFVNFYANRGYSMNTLTKIATEVETRDRNCLLKPRVVEQNKDNRVPLVITWHQKFKGLSKILHRHYNFMVIEHPDLQKVFPEPPIVSYRRNPNLHNHLVRTKPKENAKAGFSVRCTLEKTKKRGRPCKLCTHMGQKNEITNARTGKTCHIDGGSCNSKNVIYAAECTKHKLIYVGYTSTTLSQRFNKHRSDAKNDPDATELGKHFHESDSCSFEKDLKVHILQRLEGDRDKLEHFENLWISRLDCKEPNGLNSGLNELGKTYYKLYKHI